jgi:hypothetical protein
MGRGRSRGEILAFILKSSSSFIEKIDILKAGIFSLPEYRKTPERP